MVNPEVQGALIGVGAMLIAWLSRASIFYIRAKINGKFSDHLVCPQHENLVAAINKINEWYEDEKHIKLYMEAIKRVNEEK